MPATPLPWATLLVGLGAALAACVGPAPVLEATPTPTEVAPTRTCPPGWKSAESGSACDAIVADTPCPAGTMPVIGQAECQPVLPPLCAAGFTPDPSGWGCADILPASLCAGATREAVGQTECQPVGDCSAPFPPADATVFVSAAYTAAQLDASHFASLAAAVAAAPASAVIAVEAGTYAERLTLDRPVTLAGRCAEQVVLQAPAGSGSSGILVNAGHATVRGLTVTGHYNGAIVHAGAELTLSDAVFDSNQILGLRVDGKATVARSVFRNGLAEAGKWGLGVMVQYGAEATLTDVAATHNRQGGIVFEDPGTAGVLERVVVRDTLPRGDGTNGDGLVVSGATADVRSSVFAESTEVGVYVASPDPSAPSEATLTDSVIRDTRCRAVGDPGPVGSGYLEFYGTNLWVVGYGHATVTRSALLRSGGASLVVGKTPANARLEDSVVRKTSPFPNGYSTTAIAVQEGGVLQVVRSAVVDGAGVGAQVIGAGSRLELSESVIADARHLPPARNGHGIEVQSLATLDIVRSAVVGSAGTALMIGGNTPGATGGACQVDASVFAHGTGYEDGTFGRAVELWNGTLDLHGSALFDNREVALVVAGAGSRATVSASVVRDTRCDGAGKSGRGINVQEGGRLDLEDSLLSRNHDVGLEVGQPDSRLFVQGGAIAETLGRTADGKFGLGVAALLDGRLDLVGVRVSRNALIGLVVDHAAATLDACTLADNAVGLHVQDGSTLSEVDQVPAVVGPLDVFVSTDTVFRGNATRMGEGTIPIPDPLSP